MQEMIDEKQNDLHFISFDASLDDWERLVRWIDKKYITEMVKHDKHLQQNEFRGFRPDHLPWNRVPKIVAQHAQVCADTRSSLLTSWHKSNIEFCRRVKEEVYLDALEDTVAKLLASIGRTEKNRDQLLWALMLDGREELRISLANSLRKALLDESSSIFNKVEQYALMTELDIAKREIEDLKAESGQLKIQNDQIISLQTSLNTLYDESRMHSQALQTIKDERDALQQERDIVCQKR